MILQYKQQASYTCLPHVACPSISLLFGLIFIFVYVYRVLCVHVGGALNFPTVGVIFRGVIHTLYLNEILQGHVHTSG